MPHHVEIFGVVEYFYSVVYPEISRTTDYREKVPVFISFYYAINDLRIFLCYAEIVSLEYVKVNLLIFFFFFLFTTAHAGCLWVEVSFRVTYMKCVSIFLHKISITIESEVVTLLFVNGSVYSITRNCST
jgi:hypothetical protein